MNPVLPLDETTLAQFCERHHIHRPALFGSHLKETARPDSDIDLLVEFDPEHIPSLLDIVGMELKFAEMLGGKENRFTHRARAFPLLPWRGGAHGRGAVCALTAACASDI